MAEDKSEKYSKKMRWIAMFGVLGSGAVLFAIAELRDVISEVGFWQAMKYLLIELITVGAN